MSCIKALGVVAVLVSAGSIATAQTAVTNLFTGLNKVIPDGQMTGLSEAHTLSVSDPLTGTWASNARSVDNQLLEDMDERTSLVDSFEGTNPRESWTLFLADLDFGRQGSLTQADWAIPTIPEPSTWTLLGLGGSAMGTQFLRRRRCRKNSRAGV